MITLWHCLNARSFRPLWTLEEMGLAYDLRMLPFPPRAHRKEYLGENVLGTIPLLVDGATRMTESSIMCHYLGTKYGPTDLVVGVEEPDYGAYLNYVVQGEATLTFPQTIVLRYSRLEPPERRLPQAVEDYGKWFLARLRWVEMQLGDGREHLCAGRFTMADISMGYAIMLADSVGLGEGVPPATRAWWERLRTRSGYHKALAAQSHAAAEQGVA